MIVTQLDPNECKTKIFRKVSEIRMIAMVLFPRRFTLIKLGIIKFVYSFCSNQNNMYNLSFMYFNPIPVSKSSQNFMT